MVLLGVAQSSIKVVNIHCKGHQKDNLLYANNQANLTGKMAAHRISVPLFFFSLLPLYSEISQFQQGASKENSSGFLDNKLIVHSCLHVTFLRNLYSVFHSQTSLSSFFKPHIHLTPTIQETLHTV